jgi:alanine dehydrogenase
VPEKAADETKAVALGTPYAKLTIGIPKETFPLERRVAATPESVARLVKPGFKVVLEADAGLASNYANADYEVAGATLVPNVWEAADIVIKVCARASEGRSLVSGCCPSFLFVRLFGRKKDSPCLFRFAALSACWSAYSACLLAYSL